MTEHSSRMSRVISGGSRAGTSEGAAPELKQKGLYTFAGGGGKEQSGTFEDYQKSALNLVETMIEIMVDAGTPGISDQVRDLLISCSMMSSHKSAKWAIDALRRRGYPIVGTGDMVPLTPDDTVWLCGGTVKYNEMMRQLPPGVSRSAHIEMTIVDLLEGRANEEMFEYAWVRRIWLLIGKPEQRYAKTSDDSPESIINSRAEDDIPF